MATRTIQSQHNVETVKNNSDYYQRLIHAYGLKEANNIWNHRGNKHINFKRLGDALTRYLKK